MIGVFARMFRREDRIVQVDELADDSGYKIQAHAPDGETTVLMNQEPSAFIDEVKYEGGNVLVAPILEALLENLRRKPKDEN